MRVSQPSQAINAELFVKKLPTVTQTPPVDPSLQNTEQGDTSIPMRVVRSEDILSGETEILIRHGCEVYRLRVTRAGKLILTK